MKTIYELQQIADRLRGTREVNSISAEDVFGLHADELEYVANLERRGDVLGIKKVYKTKAEMDADVAAPVGTDGKVLRFGQLASVWDGGNATSADNGMVYAWQGADKPWLAVGKLTSTYEYWDELLTQICSDMKALSDKVANETSDRKNGDEDLDKKISDERTARSDADSVLQKLIDSIRTTGYRFMGIATPETSPGELSENVFYIATAAGTYSNFSTGITAATNTGDGIESLSVSDGEIAILMFDGTNTAREVKAWRKVTINSTEAVRKIVNDNMRGVEDGVAPLNREGVVPMDYLPVEAIRDELMVSCTQEDYDAMVKAGTVKDDTYYNILEE